MLRNVTRCLLLCAVLVAGLLFSSPARANALMGARPVMSFEFLDIGLDELNRPIAHAHHTGQWWVPISPNAEPAVLIFSFSVDGNEVQDRILSLSEDPEHPSPIIEDFTAVLTPGHHDIYFWCYSPYWDDTEGGPVGGYYFFLERHVDIP